jgi:hypothetical protein
MLYHYGCISEHTGRTNNLWCIPDLEFTKLYSDTHCSDIVVHKKKSFFYQVEATYKRLYFFQTCLLNAEINFLVGHYTYTMQNYQKKRN